MKTMLLFFKKFNRNFLVSGIIFFVLLFCNLTAAKAQNLKIWGVSWATNSFDCPDSLYYSITIKRPVTDSVHVYVLPGEGTINNNGLIYPNPASGELSMQLPSAGQYRLAVYNISGQEVISGSGFLTVDEMVRLDVTSLIPGFYILKVQIGYEMVVHKFSK